jgi:hypothetical protein
MRFRYRSTSEFPIAGVDATDQRRLFLACAVETEVSE